MSQVNLLPSELRARAATKRTTTLVALVGGGVIVLILAFYFLQVLNLNKAKDDLAAQQQVNASLTDQIRLLQPYANLDQQLVEKQQLVATVYSNEVSWSGILLDVSRAIPTDEYLTSFTGSLTVTTGTAITTETGGLVGSIAFAGQAKTTDTLATWLTHLDQVKGWANAWMSSATESGSFTDIYNFASGVDLTTDVVTDRGKGSLP